MGGSLKFSEGPRNVFIIPPNAGHTSCIADYAPNQSLVQLWAQRGYAVYAVDWLSCTWGRRNETIQDLVGQVHTAVRTINRPLTLVGLCQAGWLSTMYTAQHPDQIESLYLAGAPLDFSADSYLKRLVSITPQWMYEMMVQQHGGLMPGYLILTGFKMMHPYDRYVDDYAKLYQATINAHNSPAQALELERIRRFRNWYETWQWLAGTWYLEAVDKLFRKNELLKGRYGNLKNIKCPVTLIAGDRDDITPPAQMFNVMPYLNISRKFLLKACGHIGLFMSKRALKQWDQIVF